MAERRSCFLALAFVLAILCASLTGGLARNIKIVRLDEGAFRKAFAEGAAVDRRGAAEVGFSAMDYNEPGANTNPWSGWATPPPHPKH